MKYILSAIIGLFIAFLTVFAFTFETAEFQKAYRNKGNCWQILKTECKKHIGFIVALPVFHSAALLYEKPQMFQISAWFLAIVVDKIVRLIRNNSKK